MRNVRSFFRLFLVLGILAGVARPAIAGDLDQLVDRVVAAYGGEAALIKARVMKQEGHFVSASRGDSGTVVRTLNRPDRLRVEISYPGAPTEVRVLDGQRGWRQGVEAPVPLVGAMVLQAARISLPAVLVEQRGSLQDRGTHTDRDGRLIQTIEVPLGPALSLSVDVDADTSLIVESRGVIAMQGMEMVFAAAYRDHRQWEGVLIAAHEEQFAMGQHIGQTIIEKVSFPVELPHGTFRP